MAKITYTDKVNLVSQPVPNENKVTAENLNEIKVSVNQNVDDITLKAAINGSELNTFKVANATLTTQAINKAQFDAAISSLSSALITLDDTNLVVVPVTNLQAFADGIDSAVLKDRSTGVTSSYVSSVSVGGTTFAQPAVEGEIKSDQGYFSIIYAGATGITVSDLTAISTYVYLDNAGALQQQITTPTRQDWSRKIFTMRIGVNTSTNTIVNFEYLNNPIGHYSNSIRDLYEYLLKQGIPFKADQVITGRAGDLGFDVSAGTLMEFGGTGDIDNANIRSYDAVSNTAYNLMSRTALVSSETNLVKFWDNAGTITALGSTTLVGHRLYRFSSGNFAMQYGQGNYANMTLAKAGVLLEDYVLNPVLKDATFFGWWFIESTATNTGGTTLTDFVEYTIGVQGGSSSSLSGALLKGNNLSDLLDAATARTNLGVTALDDANVKLTGNQSIADEKTFTGLVKITDRLELSDADDNTFIGDNSGIANTTGSRNVALGGLSLQSNTEGVYNLSLGYRSLIFNTTGSSNVASGYQSLYSNTSGDNNVASGYSSLFSNLTGQKNVALGYSSLFGNTTGDNNVASGFHSGRYITDGSTPNETGSNSIFIGADTRANADGETNQIVIGDSAIGNGSNTVTLGGAAITDTYLKGDITATADVQSLTLTPTSIATGNIPYKSAGALVDSPISTDGTDVTLSGSVSATDAKLGGSTSTETLGVHNSSRPYIHLTSDTTGKTGADGTFIGFVSTSGALEIRNKENQPINFKTNDIQALTLASDQSATFASSVSATDGIFSSGVKVGNDASTAAAGNAGTTRYRVSGNNSYMDMCMQTGASTYAWVNIKTNSW